MSFVQMSLSGAVLILAIIFIRAFTLHKFPKSSFIVMWEIALLRLLIPFSIPSVFSIYSIINSSLPATAAVEKIPAAPWVPASPSVPFPNIPIQDVKPTHPIPVFWIIWLVGFILCSLYFIVCYIKCHKKFCISLPVQHPALLAWKVQHPFKRNFSFRQSSHITAPLTYGVFRPVILLPKTIDYSNEKQLSYILTHEYLHILRYDTLKKLLLTAALCIHWFNPMVWIMYLLFNRDMELSCDEQVVRKFGEIEKSSYAFTLIHMEEVKGSNMPMCNHFSKNAIEERITAIMKIKKTSLFTIVIAIGIIMTLTVLFTTSAFSSTAPAKPPLAAVPDTGFTDAEYEKLFALYFDDYDTMAIADYQNKIWNATDTNEYMALLERFYQNEKLDAMKDSNETAAYIFYVLIPLTSERWQSRSFGGYVSTQFSSHDNAAVEYLLTLTVSDAKKVTVGEYEKARQGFKQDLQAYLSKQPLEDLQKEQQMNKAIQTEINRLLEKWGSDHLKLSIEYAYSPLVIQESQEYTEPSIQEARQDPYGTQEDYESLLKLKTANFRDLSVEAFNNSLLEWANEDYDRINRISEDTGRRDYRVSLSEEERSFLELTVYFSGLENAKKVQSIYTGKPEEDPILNGINLYKNSNYIWCNLYYQLTYHIQDKSKLTIKERDQGIVGVIQGIQSFWDTTKVEDLIKMKKSDIVDKLNGIAKQYQTDKIAVSLSLERVGFEFMDETKDLLEQEQLEKILMEAQ